MKRRTTSKGFTLIELLIVIAVIAILAALAIPNLIGSRKAANETSAISVMRTIITSEESYRSRNLSGTNVYATLAQLATAGLLTWPGAANIKSGYTFSDITAAPTATDWSAYGTPAANSGDRDFVATDDGFVRSQATGAKPATTAAAQALTALQ